MLGYISNNDCTSPSGDTVHPPMITIVLQLPKNHVKDSFEQHCQMGEKGELSLQDRVQEMTSAWRVISFFVVVFVVPTILIAVPLYARYQLYHTRTLLLSDGDVVALHDTVSSFWCQSQQIKSNGSFSAYYTKERRRSSTEQRTSNLNTKIPLRHDEAEEWGFYLVKGSTVQFSSCARWPGASLIVVQGEENMRKCFYLEKKSKHELENPIHTKPIFAQESHASAPYRKVVSPIDENHGGEISDDSVDNVVQAEISDQFSPKIKHLPNERRKSESDSKLYSINYENKPANNNSPTNPTPEVGHIPSYKTRVSRILSAYNDTQEVTYGNSSFSSSEEFLSHCTSTIYSIDVTPYINCPNKMASPQDIKQFVANESDYYFFLFSSDNSIETNVINFTINLKRVLYDLSGAMLECHNASAECMFPFAFLSHGGAIVDFHAHYDNITKLEDLNVYQLTSYCQPRSIVYTVLILLVPFIIVLFAFR